METLININNKDKITITEMHKGIELINLEQLNTIQ